MLKRAKIILAVLLGFLLIGWAIVCAVIKTLFLIRYL